MAEPLNQKFLDELRKIVGVRNVLVDPEKLEDYGHDEFSLRDIARVPPAAVTPSDTAQVAAVLALADAFRVPVTPRGGATGLCGGCVPSDGGIVLSLEKMRAIEIDEENQMAVVEPGVTLVDFIKRWRRPGFTFPPHPGDESAMIGGLIATNAGGSRAVKYGVIRNYVRGLEVVLPTAVSSDPGGKLIKSSTGLQLAAPFHRLGRDARRSSPGPSSSSWPSRALTRSLVIPFDDAGGGHRDRARS